MAIDGCRDTAMPSGFEVVIAGGTEKTGIDVVKWAKKCQELGAGVIYLPVWMEMEHKMGMI